MTLKDAMNALHLDWASEPNFAAEKIAANFNLGRPSNETYSNPNETAICYIFMWEQSHGYSEAEREAYEATDIQAISKAYFGD